jgi:exosome complex RNA-binding protein Rrp4
MENLVVTPGQVITKDASFMRGHGTYIENEQLIASVAGKVERVNKLISVKPSKAQFGGEIGDVVVGRIMELGPKRWKVDIKGKLVATLMLSSINLPGGVQVFLTDQREERLNPMSLKCAIFLLKEICYLLKFTIFLRMGPVPFTQGITSTENYEMELWWMFQLNW